MYVLVFGCKKKQRCTHTPFQEGCNTIGVQCNTVGVHDETLYTCGQSNSLKQHTRLAIIHIIAAPPSILIFSKELKKKHL